jgi:hypothetical protein
MASIHVVRYRRRSALSGLSRIELDRLPLHKVAGLRFVRSFVSGLGDRAHPWGLPVPHPTRSFLFAVWDDDAALDAFLHDSAVSRRWRAHAKEAWHVSLQPVGAHGTWGGVNPLAEAGRSRAHDGPGAVFTYVHLKGRGQPHFWPINRRVAHELVRHPGFVGGVVGTDPAPPLVRNATFSLWTSLDQALRFAYQRPASKHAEGMRRTHEERWHKEFFFARFRPYASAGTWDGDDPLATIDTAAAPVPVPRVPPGTGRRAPSTPA